MSIPPPDADFEREKLCYEQNFLQFRSLNQVMWQVPIIAMTLTGGLWFGVSKVNIQGFQYALLALACLGNTGLILVLTRIRYVMGEYLKKLKEFHELGFVQATGPGWFTASERVVSTFRLLLGLSALISVLGIVMIAAAPEGLVTVENVAKCNGS